MSAKKTTASAQKSQAVRPVGLDRIRKLILGLLSAGLVMMIISTYAYRIENPSLTVKADGRFKKGVMPGEPPPGTGATMPEGVEMPPGMTPGKGQSGAMESMMGNMGQIRELMAKAESDPTHFPTLMQLGEQFMGMGALDRALIYFEKAAAANPNDVEPLHRAGLIKFQREKHREAAETFEMILIRKPDDPMAHFNLGVVNRYYLKNEAKAQEHFKKAASIPTEDADLAKKAKEEAAKTGPN